MSDRDSRPGPAQPPRRSEGGQAPSGGSERSERGGPSFDTSGPSSGFDPTSLAATPGFWPLWPHLHRMLARLRPHRAPLSLLVDAVVIVLAWNATYLFRLGFDRWISARPSYDTAVLAGVVLLWLAVLWVLRVPRGMWRSVGFGDVRRLALACLMAGGLAASAVMTLGASGVPRAVLGLHPVMALMGLVLVRML